VLLASLFTVVHERLSYCGVLKYSVSYHRVTTRQRPFARRLACSDKFNNSRKGQKLAACKQELRHSAVPMIRPTRTSERCYRSPHNARLLCQHASCHSASGGINYLQDPLEQRAAVARLISSSAENSQRLASPSEVARFSRVHEGHQIPRYYWFIPV